MNPLSEQLDALPTDLASYRPLIVKAAAIQDWRNQMRAEASAVMVSDTIEMQLRDLVKTRQPSRHLTPAAIRELIAAELAGRAAVAYGVWVYYPWSRRLVHLLDEPEFVELRTNRNCYKITPAEQSLLATKRLGVIGLSVGQAVSLVLALERSFGELRLADFDTLDLSNLNRLRSGVHNLGLPKVIATAREIAEIDPFLKVVCFPQGITSEAMEPFLLENGKIDLLIEECDSIDQKIEIRLASRRHRIPVLMETSDRGLVDIERFDLEPDRPIFHGAIEDLDPSELRGLTNDEKVPYVLKIIGVDTISTRMRASLLEVEQSVSTWPQLASAVAMGGAVAADVARRILLGQSQISGRFFVDLEEIIPDRDRDQDPAPVQQTPENLPTASYRELASLLPGPGAGRALPLEQIRRLVEAASLAPSGGNSQPWKWLWTQRRLCLFLNKSRSWSLVDFCSLGAIVGLGAAAENLVLCAHSENLGVRLSEFPLGVDKDLVAIFEFFDKEENGDEPAENDHLAAWIPMRVTNRRNPGRQPLAPERLEKLGASITDVAGAGLRWIASEEDLDEAGRILGRSDRMLFLDEHLHREMMSELRFESQEPAEGYHGIPIASFDLSPTDRAGLEICRSWPALDLVRGWGEGRNLEKMSRKAIAASSAVGMLTMNGVTAVDYFRAGRAVERFWLNATQACVAIHPMTALSYLFARMLRGDGAGLQEETLSVLRELRPAWAKLFGLTGDEAEILVFRLSLSGPPSMRARRLPLDEILEVAEI